MGTYMARRQEVSGQEVAGTHQQSSKLHRAETLRLFTLSAATTRTPVPTHPQFWDPTEIFMSCQREGLLSRSHPREPLPSLETLLPFTPAMTGFCRGQTASFTSRRRVPAPAKSTS